MSKSDTGNHYGEPPKGWSEEEWKAHVDGLVAQSEAAVEQAKADGSFGARLHYEEEWPALTIVED